MKTSRRGVLVAIEGIDGTGKTTLQRGLGRAWRRRKLRVVEFQEPSRGPSGLRARRSSGKDPWMAALAFTDDRRHQRPRVDRALRSGAIVLLDRSLYSTLAYQGSALPAARRRELERLQSDATTLPDRVVLLDLPLRVAERRMQDRGGARAPTEHREVLRRASRAYRQLARKLGWIVLDARNGAEELLAELDRRLTPWVLRHATRERT
ncbi:MAG: dTMP kinase [Thermoplasmata archaeon]